MIISRSPGQKRSITEGTGVVVVLSASGSGTAREERRKRQSRTIAFLREYQFVFVLLFRPLAQAVENIFMLKKLAAAA